jgi:hypothetical protein
LSVYDETPIEIDEPLTMRVNRDWCVIERAQHDGRMWLEQLGANSAVLRTSARISDADVEGTREEMAGLARAILDRDSFEERRCAVRVDGDHVELWSPRNSQRPARIPYHHAEALAREILRPETA